MTVVGRHLARGLLLHSDHGVQYGSRIYRDFITQRGFANSKSGKGCCYDSAKVKRFFGALKDQLGAGKALIGPEEMPGI